MKLISDLPKKYKADAQEQEIVSFWQSDKFTGYDYNSDISRDNTFVVDTPPPTVSGSLHMGHVFSYTQTDFLVRYNRMLGKNIFYPVGWDDNGLPTERRVQNVFGVKCDSTLPYDQDFKLEETKKKKYAEFSPISRQNFIAACNIQTKKDEVQYEWLWHRLGLSVDWKQKYTTINPHCQKTAQKSFIDLIKQGDCISHDAPVMWDTQFQTAVAQAEVEDRTKSAIYHDIEFSVFNADDHKNNINNSNDKFIISTTRPELLPACVAVVAHPDDERFKHLFGKEAVTPLFEARVPILPAEHADPEKGTGILMVCTFGDSNDVQFWKDAKLPLKQVISRQGNFIDINFVDHDKLNNNKLDNNLINNIFNSNNPEKANAYYANLKGLYVKQARRVLVELLENNTDALIKISKPQDHAVKFYEKGEHPLEFVPTRQWFVSILKHKDKLLEQGEKIAWHPVHMRKRFEQWVMGLNQDWCISRQRYFGVPIPVWYKLDDNLEPDYNNPIIPDLSELPIDPQVDTPKGFDESQRNKANGFMGDPDVMDTWATSSMSPQINSHWAIDQSRHKSLYPADLRPQAHEIIRTWAFYTIAKSYLHEDQIPWHNIAISGWVINPDKTKMSKSKGNSVTPEDLITKYGADALRYWAARARLGVDTVFDESVFKVGLRLVTKLVNVSKFVVMQFEQAGLSFADVKNINLTDLDKSWLAGFSDLLLSSKKDFANFKYADVLNNAEHKFWDFCDNYVELVKTRSYQQHEQDIGKSALCALYTSLSILIRLFAPFMPFVTEQVSDWLDLSGNIFSSKHNLKYNLKYNSVHLMPWPDQSDLELSLDINIDINKNKNKNIFTDTIEILDSVRSQKTKQQVSLKAELASLEISCNENNKNNIIKGLGDLANASNINPENIIFKDSGEHNNNNNNNNNNKSADSGDIKSGIFEVKIKLQ